MKKEFTPAELELIQFDEGADIIITSTMTVVGGSDQPVGGDNPLDD